MDANELHIKSHWKVIVCGIILATAALCYGILVLSQKSTENYVLSDMAFLNNTNLYFNGNDFRYLYDKDNASIVADATSSLRLMQSYRVLARLYCENPGDAKISGQFTAVSDYVDKNLLVSEGGRTFIRYGRFTRVGALGLYLSAISSCEAIQQVDNAVRKNIADTLLGMYDSTGTLRDVNIVPIPPERDTDRLENVALYTGEGAVGLVDYYRYSHDVGYVSKIQAILNSGIAKFNAYAALADPLYADDLGMWLSSALYNWLHEYQNEPNRKQYAASLYTINNRMTGRIKTEAAQNIFQHETFFSAEYNSLIYAYLYSKEHFDVLENLKMQSIINSLHTFLFDNYFYSVSTGYASYPKGTEFRVDNNAHMFDTAWEVSR